MNTAPSSISLQGYFSEIYHYLIGEPYDSLLITYIMFISILVFKENFVIGN